MAFKKLVAPSLTELFVQELEHMIISGKLKIGERLPPERQLAKEMDVSLAVINAGITRLTSLGFLRVEPRKGTFIADYIHDGNIDTLKEIIEYTGNKLDLDIFDPIVEFRRGIETISLRYACQNRTEKSIATLSELIAQATRDEELSNLPQIAFNFHHEIAIASGNIYYPMIIQSFEPIYEMFYQISIDTDAQGHIIDNLQNILEAIRNQDEDAAISLNNNAINKWMASYRASNSKKE